MQKLQGIAVSPGIAIGDALVIDQEGFRIPRHFVARDAVDHELERLDAALNAAAAEIEHNRQQVSLQLGEEYGAIFSAHLQMLRDPRLRSEIDAMIRERHYSPEYAVSRSLRRYAKVFQTLDKDFLSDRASDIFDIEKRLLRQLLGRRREELSELVSPVIVLAHNLTPSETANLSPDFVRGFVTETGGPGSHTAIVAAALEIPAVIGTGPFLTDVSGGDLVIIDGDQGLVILHPDDETIARYRLAVAQHVSRATELETLRDLPAETADGQRIAIYGNIEFPHEVQHCVERGADGIGLYRTEFLYLGGDLIPDEDAHYAAYAHVIQAMQGRPVVIRTLDMGADKIMPGFDSAGNDRNPCLGLRSIRLSLTNLPLFRIQLRAVLRASVLGDVRIMFPLVSTLMELRKAKMVLADVMEDLEEQQIPFNREMQVGMMVETPAAVVLIDRFAAEVDFLSIGTNDLVQYTLAVDRGNKDVAELYNPADPSILRLIGNTIEGGAQADIPVTVCGQMSANPLYAMLLLGMGLRGFSVPPSAVPEVKRVCREVNLPQCKAVAERALGMENAHEIKSYLRGELNKILPEEMEMSADVRDNPIDHATALEEPGTEVATRAATPPVRMRIRFSKQGDLRLISHRDLARALERLFRRAQIEVQQSEGFHPKPRIMFPSALGLGIAGLDEVCEVDLAAPIAAADLLDRLAALTPPGLEIGSVALVVAGSRKARAKCLWYELALPAERVAQATAEVAQLMSRETCLTERPGRAAPVDLRATLKLLEISGGVLRMKLLATHEAQARPRDILAVLGLSDLESHGLLVRSRVELE